MSIQLKELKELKAEVKELKGDIARLTRMLAISLERKTDSPFDKPDLNRKELASRLSMHEKTAEKLAYYYGVGVKRVNGIEKNSYRYKTADIDTKILVEPENWVKVDLTQVKVPRQ